MLIVFISAGQILNYGKKKSNCNSLIWQEILFPLVIWQGCSPVDVQSSGKHFFPFPHTLVDFLLCCWCMGTVKVSWVTKMNRTSFLLLRVF